MPDAKTASNDVNLPGQVTLRDIGPKGMITLRADLSDHGVRSACAGLAGVAFPETGRASVQGDRGLAWMSPDEVLVLLPFGDVPQALSQISGSLSDHHHLAVDVSDARAMFEMSGPGVRDILAKLTPADLGPKAAPPGTFRRTRFGQVAGAFWVAAEDRIVILCFRSVADYTFALLSQSARDGAVGYHSAV
jgi:sarcosine oxidase subunit gamma